MEVVRGARRRVATEQIELPARHRRGEQHPGPPAAFLSGHVGGGDHCPELELGGGEHGGVDDQAVEAVEEPEGFRAHDEDPAAPQELSGAGCERFSPEPGGLGDTGAEDVGRISGPAGERDGGQGGGHGGDQGRVGVPLDGPARWRDRPPGRSVVERQPRRGCSGVEGRLHLRERRRPGVLLADEQEPFDQIDSRGERALVQAVGGGAGHAEHRLDAGGPETPFKWDAEPVLALDVPDDRRGIDQQPPVGEAQDGTGDGGSDGGDVGGGFQGVAGGADPIGGMFGDERGERARGAGGCFRRFHRGEDGVFVRPGRGRTGDHQPAAAGVEGGPGHCGQPANAGLEIGGESVDAVRVDPVDGHVEVSATGPHRPGMPMARGLSQGLQRVNRGAQQPGRRGHCAPPGELR